MWPKTDRPRPILGTVLVLLAAYFLLPLSIGIVHIGMLYPAAALGVMASMCFWPRWPEGLPRWLRRLGAAVMAVGLCTVLGLWIAMAAAANQRPEAAEPPGTVIVLGCQVTDERPSVMLQSRIDAAYAYLAAHPEAVCVASGGMDDEETITEGACIARTLAAMGIAPERIFVEERSRSTWENLSLSAQVIEEEGLDRHVALASDNFHQLRAGYFARRAGLDPCSLGCRSYWALCPGYWAREVPAVLAAWIRGY